MSKTMTTPVSKTMTTPVSKTMTTPASDMATPASRTKMTPASRTKMTPASRTKMTPASQAKRSPKTRAEAQTAGCPPEGFQYMTFLPDGSKVDMDDLQAVREVALYVERKSRGLTNCTGVPGAEVSCG